MNRSLYAPHLYIGNHEYLIHSKVIFEKLRPSSIFKTHITRISGELSLQIVLFYSFSKGRLSKLDFGSISTLLSTRYPEVTFCIFQFSRPTRAGVWEKQSPFAVSPNAFTLRPHRRTHSICYCKTSRCLPSH